MSYLHDGEITTLNQQDGSGYDDGGPMADDDVDADVGNEDLEEEAAGEENEDLE